MFGKRREENPTGLLYGLMNIKKELQIVTYVFLWKHRMMKTSFSITRTPKLPRSI